MHPAGFLALLTVLLMAAPASAQDAAAGEKAFLVCRACHQIGPTAKSGVGPSLNGIVGRTAGTYPGFAYSPANKNSGLVWDQATLEKYLPNPQALIPGTKMSFAGLKDPQKVKDVIAFLGQYRDDGTKTP
ncbi:MAG: cytochrome c family protein [Acetobacteraceae bacterium]